MAVTFMRTYYARCGQVLRPQRLVAVCKPIQIPRQVAEVIFVNYWLFISGTASFVPPCGTWPLEWHLWQQMDWTWMPNRQVPHSPDLTPLDFNLWGVHENPGAWDSCGDTTISCGTITSSSWNHPWYAGNISKSLAWHNQAIHKMYRSWWRPYWAPSVSE